MSITPGPIKPLDIKHRPLRSRKGKPPRYHTVTEALRRELVEGRLAAGVKLPALRELADQFKVSTNTIRNAIRILEHEGCLYHVPDVGAFVHPKFPNRSATEQITIALATIDIGGAFEMGIARGVEQACQSRGWSLQVYDARADAQLESRNLSRLIESGTRGAIMVPINSHENLETLVKLKLAEYPIVLVDRAVPGLKVDLVESNHEQGAYTATEYLLKQGHRHVLMVTDLPDATSVASRIRGFERALLDHGIEPAWNSKLWIDPQLGVRGVQEGRRWLGGYEAALPMLKEVKEQKRSIAIFAINDYCTWGIFEACRSLGLRIPEDVSVVSFDDSDIIRALHPPVTTVAQRLLDIGRTALDLLERRLKAGKTQHEPEHVLVDVDLIERSSAAPPAHQ